jgi:peroxiredoxin
MSTREPIQAGEAAPDFSLPAVHRDGNVSLGDYRGKSPVLVAIFRGLYCPFCRRGIAQLSAVSEKLRAAGVETLAVVATEADNARLYFKHRPSKMPIVADPECSTHRAFGLPSPPVTDDLMKVFMATKINPTGELPEPMNAFEASQKLDAIDGHAKTPTDVRDNDKHPTQLKGQFLLDRDGIVRWANIECGQEGIPGFGKFPTDADLLAAVRALA